MNIGPNGEKSKVLLTTFLSDHGIWQEQAIWQQMIQKVINQKFHEAVQSPQVQAARGQHQSYAQ